MIVTALLIVAAAADPAPAPPAPPAPPSAQRTAAAVATKAPIAPPGRVAAVPDKVICHSDIKTGSRFGSTKECHTAAEWRQIDGERVTNMDKATAMKWSQ